MCQYAVTWLLIGFGVALAVGVKENLTPSVACWLRTLKVQVLFPKCYFKCLIRDCRSGAHETLGAVRSETLG
jgi:hypothetical protein